MDAITALLALTAALFVGAFIAQPFVSGGGEEARRERRRAASVLRQRAELLTERNRIYAAIRDLDFDYKTNKVSDDDYAEQRYRLVAEGVEVLQLLDALPAVEEPRPDDPVEALIAARRSGEAPSEVRQDDPVEAAVAARRSPASAGEAPVAVAAGPGQAAFCAQCGTPAEPGDRFCGSCGARL